MKKSSYLFAILTIFSLTTPVLAHSWYPIKCCHDQDCEPVPCDELQENNDGTYSYGKHKFTKDQINPSQDNKCHVCIMKHAYQFGGGTYEKPMCVFVLQGS